MMCGVVKDVVKEYGRCSGCKLSGRTHERKGRMRTCKEGRNTRAGINEDFCHSHAMEGVPGNGHQL